MKTFSTVLLSGLLLFTLFFSACATTSNYDARVRSWEGKNAEVLVKTWGKPDTTEKQSTGNRIYLYTRLKHPAYAYSDSQHREIASDEKVPDQKMPDQKMYVKCATYFEVTPDNRVVSAFFRGDECKSKD